MRKNSYYANYIMQNIGNKYLLFCTLGSWSTGYEIEVYALNPHYSLFYVFALISQS